MTKHIAALLTRLVGMRVPGQGLFHMECLTERKTPYDQHKRGIFIMADDAEALKFCNHCGSRLAHAPHSRQEI